MWLIIDILIIQNPVALSPEILKEKNDHFTCCCYVYELGTDKGKTKIFPIGSWKIWFYSVTEINVKNS